MKLLHNIGPRLMSNYNTPEEIASYRGDISFDGIYFNVFQHPQTLRAWRELNPTARLIFFVQGYNIGGDNSMDAGAPKLEQMCTVEQVMDLVHRFGGELGWHSWTHPNLTLLDDDSVIREITAPPWCRTKTFAYPFGNVDERVADLVCRAGYEEAWSVTQGNGSLFQKRRSYLNW